MGIIESFVLLKKIGVDLDIGCVYQVVYDGDKIRVHYQGVIEIDEKKVFVKNGFKV